jgi:hypothetical protein
MLGMRGHHAKPSFAIRDVLRGMVLHIPEEVPVEGTPLEQKQFELSKGFDQSVASKWPQGCALAPWMGGGGKHGPLSCILRDLR